MLEKTPERLVNLCSLRQFMLVHSYSIRDTCIYVLNF